MTQWTKNDVEKAMDCPMTRRRFMKWLTAAGVAAAMPCGFLRSQTASAAGIIYEGGYETFRNAVHGIATIVVVLSHTSRMGWHNS